MMISRRLFGEFLLGLRYNYKIKTIYRIYESNAYFYLKMFLLFLLKTQNKNIKIYSRKPQHKIEILHIA